MTLIIKGKARVDDQLNETTILWRYLDTAKFLDLIHNQRLFFIRGDQLEDKFEGAFTTSIRQAIDNSYEINKISFTAREWNSRLREKVFLNCWHANINDNMAMWKIYGRSENSIAITTTVQKLRDTINAARIPYELAIKKK